MYKRQWQLSAAYTHAFASPGNPAMLSVNNALLAPAATLQANQFSDAANQYSAGIRYWFCLLYTSRCV